jgi:hypothetical protein
MSANSFAGSPRIIKLEGFVIKMTYTQGGTAAEPSVEFIHDVGNRNFDEPMVDKIYKKIALNYETTGGELEVQWTTENATGTFTIDLTQYPARWESFFPSNAFGRILDIRLYKNDLEDFKIKEIKGLYTPEPMII